MVSGLSLMVLAVVVGPILGQIVTLTTGEKEELLDAHRYWRDLVTEAKDMKPVNWNDDIAKYAQDLLESTECTLKHGMSHNLAGKYPSVGQNLALNMANNPLSVLVDQWGAEKDFYIYNPKSSGDCKDGEVCGHYSQVVWANSMEIGCAKKECVYMDKYNVQILACNYGPPGNYIGQYPYTV